MAIRLIKMPFLYTIPLSLLLHILLLAISLPDQHLTLNKNDTGPNIDGKDEVVLPPITVSTIPRVNSRSELSEDPISEKAKSEIKTDSTVEVVEELQGTQVTQAIQGSSNNETMNYEINFDDMQENQRVQEHHNSQAEYVLDNNVESIETIQDGQGLEEKEDANTDPHETVEASQEDWNFKISGTTQEYRQNSYNSWTDKLRNFNVSITQPIPLPAIQMPFPPSACHLDSASSWTSIFMLYLDTENKLPDEDEITLIQSSGYQTFNQHAFEAVSEMEISAMEEGNLYAIPVTFQYNPNVCKSI